MCKLRRMCQITDAASSSSRPSATCSFQIERSITFALLELFPSYSHGASEQLSVTLCGTRDIGGVFKFLSRNLQKFISRENLVIFYQIRNCSAILKFCEFFAKYAAVSLPIVTPHWVYLGAIWVRIAAALAASCCRRRLAALLQPWLPRCLSAPSGPRAAALAASLSVGAAGPALLQPWLPRCLSAPSGPRCCSLGCFVVCRRRMALAAAALAASLPSSLGTPRRGRASTGRALAEVMSCGDVCAV